jgi:phosphoglycolate phosphatase-like HAD superfamily hydrolase
MSIVRSSLLAVLVVLTSWLSASAQTTAISTDPLSSWNDGIAKHAILDFVRNTTDAASTSYVLPEDRIATFDQDGTLWVEHPMYTQVVYGVERVQALVAAKPELKNVEPFKTVLSRSREAIAKLSTDDLLKILGATLSGMSVDQFKAEAKHWLDTARDPRWKRPYTELTYLPMIELLKYLRANSYRTYIVTGGGQDFVRVYAQEIYGVPPEQVVGTAAGTKYGYDKNGTEPSTSPPAWNSPPGCWVCESRRASSRRTAFPSSHSTALIPSTIATPSPDRNTTDCIISNSRLKIRPQSMPRPTS